MADHSGKPFARLSLSTVLEQRNRNRSEMNMVQEAKPSPTDDLVVHGERADDSSRLRSLPRNVSNLGKK